MGMKTKIIPYSEEFWYLGPWLFMVISKSVDPHVVQQIGHNASFWFSVVQNVNTSCPYSSTTLNEFLYLWLP